MRDGTVVWVDDDKNPDGGWGPYVVVRTRNNSEDVEFVLFGHLGTIFVEVGDEVRKGGVVADIGAPPDNGGWWSHLHLQCISRDYYEWCCDNDINKTLDGYFPCSQLDLFRVRFPDPSALLWDATADVASVSGRSGLSMP
jgi:murein DD-endopeptidase MepM/ murein hydrolase activator NlpD